MTTLVRFTALALGAAAAGAGAGAAPVVAQAPRPVNGWQTATADAAGLGCGVDACQDSSRFGEYNYLHPNWHPWWNGTTAHTLQSVTKSVTATLFGVAMQRGQIRSLDTPLLSYFKAYESTKVDPRLRKATLADLLTTGSDPRRHSARHPERRARLHASDRADTGDEILQGRLLSPGP